MIINEDGYTSDDENKVIKLENKKSNVAIYTSFSIAFSIFILAILMYTFYNKKSKKVTIVEKDIDLLENKKID